MKTGLLVRRVQEYMEIHGMAETGDSILAAVSGGADSICLLWILRELSQRMGFRLAAFHLNHGLRGKEADRDENYVKDVCRQMDIPLEVAREDVAEIARMRKMTEEEAGRELRYFHLRAAAEQLGCKKIAVAHHKDDQSETVLMNLFRGSGLKGLGGIRPVREMIIRPLLCLNRREIESYLREKGIEWCEDITNQELIHTRNRIRNVLMPWICENINEKAGEHLLQTANLAVQADEYFEAEAKKILEESMKDSEKKKERYAAISTARFDAQPDIMKRYLVREMIRRISEKDRDFSIRHLDAVCSLTGPGGGTETALPYGLKAIRGYETLEIRAESDKELPKSLLDAVQMEQRVFLYKKDMEIPKNEYTKWFDCDKIKGTLSVRTRQSGDFICLEDGKRKLLKRYFIDQKVPKEQRDSVLLLADGDHILWIIGYRISEYYKVTETTHTILEVHAMIQ